MLKDVIKKYPNLSNIEGSFTQVVQENNNVIAAAAEDDSVSKEDFKELILHILDECKQTNWTKKAKGKIERFDSKYEIMKFVYNAYLKGENEGVI